MLHNSKSQTTSIIYVRFPRRYNFDWVVYAYIQTKKVSQQNNLPLFQTLQTVQSKTFFLGLQDIFWHSVDWHPTKQKTQVNSVKKCSTGYKHELQVELRINTLSNMESASVITWNICSFPRSLEINTNTISFLEYS